MMRADKARRQRPARRPSWLSQEGTFSWRLSFFAPPINRNLHMGRPAVSTSLPTPYLAPYSAGAATRAGRSRPGEIGAASGQLRSLPWLSGGPAPGARSFAAPQRLANRLDGDDGDPVAGPAALATAAPVARACASGRWLRPAEVIMGIVAPDAPARGGAGGSLPNHCTARHRQCPSSHT